MLNLCNTICLTIVKSYRDNNYELKHLVGVCAQRGNFLATLAYVLAFPAHNNLGPLWPELRDIRHNLFYLQSVRGVRDIALGQGRRPMTVCRLREQLFVIRTRGGADFSLKECLSITLKYSCVCESEKGLLWPKSISFLLSFLYFHCCTEIL